MVDRWHKKTLGEFVRLQRGHDLTVSERRPGTVPVLGSAGISGYHDEAKATGPGVTIGRSGVGSMGAVNFCKEDYWPHNTVLYVTDFCGNDERFVYYFLSHFNLRRFNSGSAQASLNRNYIYPLEICVPPLRVQRAISGILGSLDYKIELNRRMNGLLEGMARAIFKSWFVDFEPVKAKAAAATSFTGMPQQVFDRLPNSFTESALGKIPEGWTTRSVAELGSFVNGKAFTKHANEAGRMIIRIAELNSGPGASTKYSDIEAASENTAYPDDILFAWSGSLDVYRWHRDEAVINQHIFKVIPQNLPSWYAYYQLETAMPEFKLIASMKATTMGHIKRAHLDQSLFAMPTAELLCSAGEQIRPLYDLVHVNERESLKLSAIRDSLLPKLISGEVSVGVEGDG